MVRLRVLGPCEKEWAGMRGGSDIRRCTSCDRDVHDLTGMTELDALAAPIFRRDAPCVRIRRNLEGAALFRPAFPVLAAAMGALVTACGAPAKQTDQATVATPAPAPRPIEPVFGDSIGGR